MVASDVAVIDCLVVIAWNEKMQLTKNFGAAPVALWLRLLTRMQEVRGSNPGAVPPKFGAQTPPYSASRSQRCVKGPSSLKRGHGGWCTPKAEHPG